MPIGPATTTPAGKIRTRGEEACSVSRDSHDGIDSKASLVVFKVCGDASAFERSIAQGSWRLRKPDLAAVGGEQTDSGGYASLIELHATQSAAVHQAPSVIAIRAARPHLHAAAACQPIQRRGGAVEPTVQQIEPAQQGGRKAVL